MSVVTSVARVDVRRWLPEAAVVALFLVVTPFLSIRMMNDVIIWAVFSTGFNFLAGYTGQVSFGHAAYFGLGAYGTMLAMSALTGNPYVAMVCGVLLALAAGLVIGRLCLFQRDIQFALLTLAFGQMVYFIMRSWGDVTGGTNGIYFPTSVSTSGTFNPLGGGFAFYVVGLVVLLVVLLFVYNLIHSPVGKVLRAVQENERRTRSLGFDTTRYLLVSFGVSSLISGLAGAMFAALVLFITPDVLFWSTSGQVLLVTIMGGSGTLAGPLIGAAVFAFMSDILPSVVGHWRLLFGIIFILVVMFFPDGIYSFYRRFRGKAGSD